MKWILAVMILVAVAYAFNWPSQESIALATINPFDSFLSAFVSTYVPSCAWDCGPTTARIVDSIKIEGQNLWFRQRTIEHTPGRITVLNDTVWVNAGSMQQ